MSVFTDLVERLRAFIFRRREERDFEEELRFHVDMAAAERRRTGASEAEARRQSLILLGGVESTKAHARDARGTRLLDDTLSDVRFAARMLARSPGFAIVAILTLAVGIGGTTAVYSAVDAVLVQPLPYAQPGQLVRLYQDSVKDPADKGFVTPVHFLDYRGRLSSLASTAGIITYDIAGADIGSGGGVRRIRMLPVSADYFDVFRAHPILGRPFNRDEEIGANVVILSHALWEQQLSGDSAAVGRTFTMNGSPFTIAGVMPEGFSDPVAGPVDVWVPMNLGPGKDVSNATNHYVTVIARLRPDVSIAAAQAELDELSTTLAKQYPDTSELRARLYPLKDDVVAPASRALQLMLGAVVLVLALVTVNTANLTLVRSAERTREFALRSALGANRARLVRQLLVESLALALAGDLAGLVLARVLMSAIVALGAGSIPRLSMLSLDPRLLAFSLMVATISAVGFGLAPAIRATRIQPGEGLGAEGRASTAGRAQMRAREWLVVSEVALAFMLLIGAGLLIASARRMREVDLGITTSHVLVFELHLPDARYDAPARARFYDALAARTEGLPGVVAAGGVSRLPATGGYHQWMTVALSGPLTGTDRARRVMQQRVVAGNYFQAIGIPLVAGRTFDGRDVASVGRKVVVSQRLARQLFPGVDPVGQHLLAGGREAEIIGVVGDAAVTLEGDSDGYVYHAHAQFADDRNWALTQVVRVSGSAGGVEAAIRHLVASIDPELVVYQPSTLADVLGRGVAERTFTLRILVSFALVALALSALGLFGVLSYGVRARTREFGIRLALGARAGQILSMVLRQGLLLTSVGIAMGLAGALAFSRAMTSLVFHVSTLDPFVVGGTMLLMGAVAGIAAYLPARRATSVNPRIALQ